MRRAWAVLALAAGCRGDPAARALEPGSADPSRALARCDTQEFDELRVLCRVEVAAEAGRLGDPALADQACGLVPDGTWRHECHFRAGEELARAGRPADGLAHCGRAGRFDRFCVTHAAWAQPLDPATAPGPDPAARAAALATALQPIEAAAVGLPPALGAEAVQVFAMSTWFSAFYGSGHADAATARASAPGQAPQARSAFALEAARLIAPPGAGPPADAVARLQAAWRGELSIPPGASLPLDQRHGRFQAPPPIPHEEGLPQVHLFGGGRRLLGSDPDEDLLIAILEALWFRPDSPADLFLPWVDDPRARVRWTAARLLRLSGSATLDLRAILAGLARHADPGVAWNASYGLRHRGQPPPVVEHP